MATYTDSFTRADGALGTNWTRQMGSGGNLLIVSNAVGTSATDVHCLAYWAANRFADNQYSEVRITNQIDAWTGVILRADNVYDRCYMGFLFRGATTGGHGGTFNGPMIYARWDGVFTELAAVTDATWVVGDVLGFRVTGTTHPFTLTLYKNGASVLVWTDTDSTYVRSGGSPGIAIYSPAGKTLRLDDWTGSDSGTGSLTPTVRDDFNRSDAASLGTNWTAATFSPSVLKITSNKCGVTTEGQHNHSFWNADVFPDNQWAAFRWTDVAGNVSFTGVILRAEAGVDKFYAGWVTNRDTFSIYVRWLGATTLLQSFTLPANMSSGDIVRFEVTGTTHPFTIKGYQNGVLRATWTSPDGTYAKTGGSPGISVFSPAGQNLSVDDWEAGYLPSTVVVAPPAATGVTSASLGMLGQYQKHFA